MANKRVRVLPATADRLVTGWAGPGGGRVRLARPGDTDQVTGLLALADISLDPAVGAVIKAGTVASTLLRGLDHGTHDIELSTPPLRLDATRCATPTSSVVLA